MPAIYNIPNMARPISPVDFTVDPQALGSAHESIVYPGQTVPQTEAPSVYTQHTPTGSSHTAEMAWPAFDVDTVKAEHNLSPHMTEAVRKLAALSLSNSVEDVKQFGSIYKALTAEEKDAFQTHRNALVEKSIQARQATPVEAKPPVAPASQQSRREGDSAAWGPQLIDLIPQSLALTKNPGFKAYYDTLPTESQFAFDKQALADWQAASGTYGQAALNGIGVFEPKRRWRSVRPGTMDNYYDPKVTARSYNNVVGDFTALQDRRT